MRVIQVEGRCLCVSYRLKVVVCTCHTRGRQVSLCVIQVEGRCLCVLYRLKEGVCASHTG